MADFQLKKMAEFKDPDRLSQLPESILDYILSFLSTEEASRTSVLSKHWRHRWLCGASEFDFNTTRHIKPLDLGCPTRYHPDVSVMSGLFFEWVTNVLESHNVRVEEEEARGLRKLRFQFPLELDSWSRMKVDEWLTFAFAKKLQGLELDLLQDSAPKNTYSSTRYCIPRRLIAKTETDLSFLRSLSLVGVDVTSEDIGTFLERFRFLDHLKVCHSYTLACVEIDGPSTALKHLEIINPEMVSVHICNTCLVSLAFNWAKFVVLENNPKLVSIRVTGFCRYGYIDYSDIHVGNGAQLQILSRYLPRLQIFNLNLNYFTKRRENLDQVPRLNELKELSLTVHPERRETTARLTALLSSSPNLEKLVLQFVSPLYFVKKRAYKKGSFTLDHLKTVEVKGYDGSSEAEDELLNFIFKLVAAPLEKIIFDPHTLSHDYFRREVYKASVPKAEMSVEKRANRLKGVVEMGFKRFRGAKKRARFFRG